MINKTLLLSLLEVYFVSSIISFPMGNCLSVIMYVPVVVKAEVSLGVKQPIISLLLSRTIYDVEMNRMYICFGHLSARVIGWNSPSPQHASYLPHNTEHFTDNDKCHENLQLQIIIKN